MRAALAAVAVMFVALTSFAAPVAAGAAPGHEVPFKGSFGGVATITPIIPPLPPVMVSVLIEGQGDATQLGRFTVRVPHVVTIASRSGLGSYEFTAANGDTLFADFTGHATPTVPSTLLSITETATITGGTGRFARATGSFIVERMFDQTTGVTTGAFEGTISSPGAS